MQDHPYPRTRKHASWINHKRLDQTRLDRLLLEPVPSALYFSVVIGIAVAFLVTWLAMGAFVILFPSHSFWWMALVPLGVGYLQLRHFRKANQTIVLDKTGNRITIGDQDVAKLSDIRRLYIAQWQRQSVSSSRITIHELNVMFSNGRTENLVTTPFEKSFHDQSEKISRWLGIRIANQASNQA